MIFQTAALSAESLGSSLLSLASLSNPNYIVHCYHCQKLVGGVVVLLTRAVDCGQHSAFRHVVRRVECTTYERSSRTKIVDDPIRVSTYRGDKWDHKITHAMMWQRQVRMVNRRRTRFAKEEEQNTERCGLYTQPP